MKALCVGHSTYDISCVTDKYPEENSKNEFSNVYESSGGCAFLSSYFLSKLGVETYLASCIGDDSFGTIIKKDAESAGVRSEYIEVSYGKRTDISFIMINSSTNSRTIMEVSKEKLLKKKTTYDQMFDLVLTDGYDYGASLDALNKYSNSIKIIDAGRCNQETVELCKYCDYIVASKDFAQYVAGQPINLQNSSSLVSVYNVLLNKFPNKIIIVTLEEKGALYMKDNQIKVMPGLQAKVVDTTGAGDIFHGGFAYALLNNYELERAITFANIAGGLSVTKQGGVESIPSISDIMVYYNQKYPNDNLTPEKQATATPTSDVSQAPTEQASQ